MKWNEMTDRQKLFFVTGCICGIIYLVLSFPALRSSLSIPATPLKLLLGIFWLCMGITTKSKILKITYYAIAGMWLLLSMVYIFLG